MPLGHPRISEGKRELNPRVAHAWLRANLYANLEAEAKRRGVHADQLTALIVGTVLTDGLVEAVLDR